jgi:PAS domain S-box-containing protein
MAGSYQQYFDAMPCYLTVQDRDLRIIEANARFRRDFGDFEGRRCYQAYKQRSEKCEACPVEQAFEDGQCHRSEEAVRRLDGREVSVLVEATPLRNDQGEIVAVMEMSADVTQMKRLETQLRQSQERYRLLFEEVPCYLSIQDRELRIVETNRAFHDDFGNALGRKCYEAYKHRSEACFPCTVQQTFQDGLPHTQEETVTSLRGERRNVLVTTAPFRDAVGQIVSVMEMSADITQVRQLESQLTSLGLLIGSISHGLKGLLNGLAGGMYLVESGLKKDDRARVQQGWEIVQRNVVRIRGMVSDILYYAKDRAPNWEPLAAAEIVREVAAAMEPRARDQGARLTAASDSAAGTFEADGQAIRSLLLNLIENALDACRLDQKKLAHEIALRVKGLPDRVRFEVEDNGIGMDRETREKAFTLFFSSKGMEGTGLGLFISHRIAQAHGGAIALESQPGVGTKFTVEFPRRRPPDKPGAAPASEKEAPRA